MGKTLLSNTVLDYIIAILVFIVILSLIGPIITLVLKIGKHFASKTNSTADDKIIDYFIHRKKSAFVPLEVVIAFFISIRFLSYDASVARVIDGGAVVLCTFFIVTMVLDFIKYLIKSKYGEANGSDPRANSLYLLLPVIKVVVWGFAVFFMLSNLGIDVTAILTGLGIGGVAIALASQAFLSDLLSFVSIVSDKPIEIGDYISIGGIEGTVKKIGIKSVRIEQYTGEEVVVPNSKITGSDLHNFRRMNRRRGDINLNLVASTTDEQLHSIEEICKGVCAEDALIEFVRCHWTGYSDGAIQFVLTYFVLDSDFGVFSSVRQRVNFRIREEFAKHKILSPKPTITVLNG
jgi:small-conductance mechanosensitive channel